jgi:molybdopterin synthase sulfur carrier subunit
MPVTLSLPTILARLTDGQATLEADGATVGEVVSQVAGRYPQLAPRLRDANGGAYPFIAFYLNDEDTRFLGGLEAPVTEGDEITVVLAVAGG